MLGFAGGVIGTGLGIIAVAAVSAAREWTTTLEPFYVLPAPLIGAAAGVLAGLQLAWRASRVTPASALRTAYAYDEAIK